MTTVPPATLPTPAAARSGPTGATWLLYRIVLRILVTRSRLVALIAVGSVGIVMGIAIGLSHNLTPDRQTVISNTIVGAYGFNLVVPVTALVFASAAFGDPTDDRTMVYLWLTPIARWRLVAASLAAALTVSAPVAVVPVTVSAALGGGTAKLVAATAVCALLATVAYTTVFLGLGLLVRRALAWGLAYVLIWELAVARVAKGAAKLSIGVYARSLAAHMAGLAPPRNAASLVASLIVPPVVIVAAFVLTVRALRKAEVA